MKQVGISQVDAVFSNGSYPIEFFFYYEPAFDTRRLRKALPKLSSAFWPAFGRYADGAIRFDKYRETECFDEEAIDQEFDVADVGASGAEVITRFALPPLERLLFLKAIRFKNGLALIPKLNHLAGDGYSYFLLLATLAAVARPTMNPFRPWLMKFGFRPDHRRTVLRDFSFRSFTPPPPAPPGNLTLDGEDIPRRDVQAVIQEAASSAGLRISGNDVLSALALKRLAKAGAGSWAEDIRLTIPVDVRGKVKEYGRGFFGNGIMFHALTLKREFIEASTALAIASEIRQSMPSLSREAYIDFLKSLEEIMAAGRWDEFKPYDPEKGCLVTNLSRLPADKLDFGAGPPRLSLPLTIERNGVGILANKENYLLRYAY